jgi:polyribonucleotide nucleotidyltransferase
VSPANESTYTLFAPNEAALAEGKEMIQTWLTEEREPQLEFGAILTAKIVEVRESGVMLSLHPAMAPVWLHNSQLDRRKVSECHIFMFEA